MQNLLRRLTLPLVLTIFGIVFIQIGHTQFKQGHFTYTSQDGRVQTFSPTENPTVFWGFSIGLFVVATLVLAVAAYLFFRLRPAHPADPPMKGMPAGLRFLSTMCFAFALFLPLSLLPFGSSINGQEVSFGEFWRRGGGPAFFIAGILFPIAGYGFLRVRSWSRYLFIGISVASAIFSLFASLLDVLIGLLWAAAVTYYLFWWPAVRDYFRVSDTTST